LEPFAPPSAQRGFADGPVRLFGSKVRTGSGGAGAGGGGGPALANCCPGVGGGCPGSNPSYVLLRDNFDDVGGFSEDCWAGGLWKEPTRWTQETTIVAQGTGSLRLEYAANSTGPGFEQADDYAANREVYVAYKERLSSGWQVSGVGQKGMKNFATGVTENQIEMRMSLFGNGYHFNTESGISPELTSPKTVKMWLPDNTWVCIEGRMKWNTAGQSNGEWQMWNDGVSQFTETGLNFTDDSRLMTAIMISAYYNQQDPCTEASPCAPAAIQYRYIDDLTVSTQRVGCT
jgi:hypothetical protein